LEWIPAACNRAKSDFISFASMTFKPSLIDFRWSETPAAWLDYRQLAIRWDEAFDTLEDSGSNIPLLKHPVTSKERQVYSQLSELGFSFRDLVKYNDYHSETGPSLQILHKVTWNDPETYFSVVEQAYRNFYLRPEFVSSYNRLLNSGY